MIKATLTVPKLKTRTVWAGVYGGHYDIIVFFKNKPTHFVTAKMRYEKSWDEEPVAIEVVDLLEEDKGNIVGDMALSDFQELYPDADLSKYLQDNNKNGRPKAIEIPKKDLFKLELATMWDGDSIRGINCNIDWGN